MSFLLQMAASTQMWRQIFIVWAILALVPGASWGDEIVSVSAAQVGKHVITSREVGMHILVEAALSDNADDLKRAKIPDVESEDFQRQLNAVILEWVVYLESQSFSAAQVSSARIDKVTAKANKMLRAQQKWRQLEVSADELRAMVHRKLQAEKFIRFKAKASVVPVTDKEARDYFQKNRLKFGNLPFKNFKDNIKRYLRRQRMDQRLKDWFEVLQSKYNVQNLLVETS